MKKLLILTSLLFCISYLQAQNSKVGDGFGGRLWYKPMNYTTGSYSAYTVCGSNSQLYGWGNNTTYQLGTNSVNYSEKPMAIEGMDKIEYYSTGYLMGAIRNGNEGWVWGNILNPTPTKVIDDVTFLDASIACCSFIKKDGTVWSIGSNSYGMFGIGPNTGVFRECKQMVLTKKAVRVACSGWAIYVLCEDGSVWGAGTIVLGNQVEYPVKIAGFENIVDIKATTNSLAALDKDGNVWTMGFPNEIGRTGDNDKPGKVLGLSNIVALSGCADGFHFLALDENKKAYAWGDNTQKQCGKTSPNVISTPVILATDVIDIMAGEWYNYIVKSDYNLYVNGYDLFIWLDQPRPVAPLHEFMKLDPTVPEMGMCKPLEYTENSNISYPDTLKDPFVTLLFPNAFSPNSDNLNDVFRPTLTHDAIVQSYSLKIFNRWGQQVFSTNDVYQGWNGKFKSKPCEIGTYFFLATYTQVGWKSPIVVKEDLTLLR